MASTGFIFDAVLTGLIGLFGEAVLQPKGAHSRHALYSTSTQLRLGEFLFPVVRGDIVEALAQMTTLYLPPVWTKRPARATNAEST